MQSFIKVFALGLMAALTVTACAKSSNSSESTTAETTSAAAQTSSAPMQAVLAGSDSAAGAKVYQANCSSCHQADGKGLAGAFPPLAGNPNVTGDPAKVIHIVKFGLTGKIDVEGHAFNGIMPPWGSQLSNADIARAVTHIRTSWGNKAGPVTEAQVAAAAK